MRNDARLFVKFTVLELDGMRVRKGREIIQKFHTCVYNWHIRLAGTFGAGNLPKTSYTEKMKEHETYKNDNKCVSYFSVLGQSKYLRIVSQQTRLKLARNPQNTFLPND